MYIELNQVLESGSKVPELEKNVLKLKPKGIPVVRDLGSGLASVLTE
jgi:hypothetical protein